MKTNAKALSRIRRKRRVRRKIHGTADRPRMSVFKSNKHIYVQVVDDDSGVTLAAASTLSPTLRDGLSGLNKSDAARKVGSLAAEACKQANITQVVFDRNGYNYMGRIAAVAEAARAGGLEF